jgi:predicted transcriptional regulator
MMTLEQARGLVKKGLRELARDAGVGKDTVSRIEAGRLDPENVSYGDIMRIVRALQRAGLPGLSVEELFPIRDEASV